MTKVIRLTRIQQEMPDAARIYEFLVFLRDETIRGKVHEVDKASALRKVRTHYTQARTITVREPQS